MLLILVQDLEHVSRELDQFLVGLRGLQRQELSIDLIPEEVLTNALRNLNDHVRTEHTAFMIAQPDTAYYYKYAKPS